MSSSSEFSDVFVSYRRKNVEFTKQLVDAIRGSGKEVWIDWEDIPPASTSFPEDLKRGIEGANAFISIISPDYIESSYCMDVELGYALELNKKIIPVILERVPSSDLPDAVRKINWIWFTPHAGHENTFEESFHKVVQALDSDYDYIRMHARLLLKAKEWESSKFNYSYLLRGDEITEAENFIHESDRLDKEPVPLNLQRNFVVESRYRQQSIQRRLLIGVTSALVVTVILGILSFTLFLAANDARLEANLRAWEALESASLLLADRADETHADGFVIPGLSLAIAASGIQDPPPPAQRVLSEVSYRTGVREIYEGHSNDVWSVAISLDGTLIASGSKDGMVLVQDKETGEEVSRFDGHIIEEGEESWVWDVVFMPDGQSILSGGDDWKVIQWDVWTGEVIREFDAHDGAVTDIELTEDGRWMLTASFDQTVIMWNMETGEQFKTFDAAQSRVYSVAFNSDETQFVSGGGSTFIDAPYEVIVYDIETEEPTLTIDTFEDYIISVDFSPDDSLIYAADIIGAIYEYSTDLGTQRGLLFDLTNSGTWNVAFSSDGRYALQSTPGRFITLWDLQTKDIVDEFVAHEVSVWAVAFSPDETQFVSGSADDTVMLWDLQSGNIDHKLVGHSTKVIGSDVLIGGDTRLAVTSAEGGEVIIWDLENKGPLQRLEGEHTRDVFRVRFTPDGSQVVTASADHSLVLWDLATGEPIRRFVSHTRDVLDFDFSPDGRTLISAAWDGRVILWDVATGEPIREFVGHDIRIFSVDFHPSGRYAVSADANGVVIVWDIEKNVDEEQIVRRLDGHTTAVIRVRISPDGQTVLTGATNADLFMWNFETGRLLRELSGHDKDRPIWDIVFSEDSKLAYSGGSDSKILIWDLEAGEAFSTMLHPGDVRALSLYPGESIILSGGSDGTVHVNDIRSFDEIVVWVRDNRVVRELTCSERLDFRIRPLCDDSGIVPTSTPFQTSVPTSTFSPVSADGDTETPEPTITPTVPTRTPTHTPTPRPTDPPTEEATPYAD